MGEDGMDDEDDDDYGLLNTCDNLQINYNNGKFTDHDKLHGYQVGEGVIIVHSKDGTSHIYPLSNIQNITVNPK